MIAFFKQAANYLRPVILSLLNKLPNTLSDPFKVILLQDEFVLGELSKRALTNQSGTTRVNIGPGFLGLASTVVTTDPKLIRLVADYGSKRQGMNDPSARKIYDNVKELLGDFGIVVFHSGKKGAKLRHSLSNFTVNASQLERLRLITEKSFSDSFKHWNSNEEGNFQIARAGMRAMGEHFMGFQNIPDELVQAIPKAEQLAVYGNPKSAEFQEFKTNLAKLNNKLIRENRSNILHSNSYLNEFHQNMKIPLDSLNVAGGMLVQSNMTKLIKAAILEIANNPAIQTKLQNEIESLKATGQYKPTHLDTHRGIPYLDMLYKECLRYHSPTALIGRQSSRAFKLGHLNLPARTYMFVPIAQIMRSPKYFKAPNFFNPGRFESNDIRVNRFPLIPFSLGMRNCPARLKYARQMFDTALLTVFSSYRLSLDKPLERVDPNGKLVEIKEKYKVLTKPLQQERIASPLLLSKRPYTLTSKKLKLEQKTKSNNRIAKFNP